MVNKIRGTKDVTVRMKPDVHEKVTDFIGELNRKLLGKITMTDYIIRALQEQMERDKKEYNIK